MSGEDHPDQILTEAVLRESAQRMRAILETVIDGIIVIDERGIIESLNPAACRIFGYTPADVVGRNVSTLMPQPYRGAHDGYIANYLRSGDAKIIGIGREVVGLRKDGSTFPMDLSVGEVHLGDRRLFTGVVRDISERRNLELAVAAAAENERARIARELHDGLAQQLGGLLFLMKGLHRDLEDGHSPQAATAGQLCDELGTALAQARNLAHELYAVSPRPDGLVSALEGLAARVSSERGIACGFSREGSTDVPQPAIASHLFRIAQEAVQNALKHSGATRIDLALAASDTGLRLRVADNGRGFSAGPTGGVGLHTMEQRARLLGGHLSVRGASAGGTEVICAIPSYAAKGETPADHASPPAGRS